jgi:hypothetical protein
MSSNTQTNTCRLSAFTCIFIQVTFSYLNIESLLWNADQIYLYLKSGNKTRLSAYKLPISCHANAKFSCLKRHEKAAYCYSEERTSIYMLCFNMKFTWYKGSKFRVVLNSNSCKNNICFCRSIVQSSFASPKECHRESLLYCC